MDDIYFDEVSSDKLIAMAQVHVDELKRLENLPSLAIVDCTFNSGDDPNHEDCLWCSGSKILTKADAVALIEDSLERLGD